MKKYLPGMMIVSVLVAVVLWAFKNYYLDQSTIDDPIISEPYQVESSGDMQLNPESVLAEKNERTPGKKNAKRIVHVPDKTNEEPQSERELDIELQESTKIMLETALDGKAEDAISISELARQCNQGMTEEWVRIRLKSMSKADFNPQTRHSFGNAQMMSFSSFEEIESTLWAQFDQCRAIQGLFNDDLRERIQQLADNGNVMARYIYAMWPPVQGGMGSEETLQLLEYQNRALEYTWLNVEEAEPIGLLAYGQSYGSAHGLFTPSNYVQNEIFLLAANKCGLGGPWLEAKVAGIRQKWIEITGGSTDLPIDVSSNEIKELFCD